jgi:hypothetical protein
MFELLLLDMPAEQRPVLACDVWVYLLRLNRPGVLLWHYLVGRGIWVVTTEIRWADYAPDRPFSEIFDQRKPCENQRPYYFI